MNALLKSEQLHQRVQRWIQCVPTDARPEPFERLALDLAAFQAQANPTIAHLFAAHRFDPEHESALDRLPAVPCDVFRLRRIASHPAANDERCFLTSGSSGGPMARGQHPMRTTATYRLAALDWAQQWLWPDGRELDFIGLAPHESQAPESSLSFMLTRFSETLSGRVNWHAKDQTIQLDELRETCRQSVNDHAPALVVGTSFAFVHLCDQTQPGELRLAPNSRIMQTGGFKGRSREVEASALQSMIAARFGLSVDRIVSEYGMTELSSQLYQGTLRAALGLRTPANKASLYFPPPWMRVSAVDPISLQALKDGEAGIARIIDLANVDSAVAIQTVDRVIVHEQGGVELLGRQNAAPARGCSLTMEHLVAEHPS